MALFRCRNFLGCMPLVLGVWLLSISIFLLGAAGAVTGWLKVTLLTEHPIPLEDKAFLFVQAIVFSLLSLLSLIGVAAAASKGSGILYIYGKIVLVDCILTIVALVLTCISTFRHIDDSLVAQCTNGSSTAIIIQFCTPGWSLVKGLSICLLGASLLFQVYTLIIVRSYAYKRDLKEISGLVFPDTASFEKGPFDPLKSLETV